MGKKKGKDREEIGKVTPRRQELYDVAGDLRKRLLSDQTPFEKEYIPQSQGFSNAYKAALERQTADYGDIMGGYRDWRAGLKDINLRQPRDFTFREVSAPRSPEWGEGIGRFRNLAETGLATPESEFALKGYRDFAETGGYSPTDIQELRARGVGPVRAGYANTMRELERARTLGGGAPNFIAAASRAQRELPGQMADVLTGVNAELANAVRQGKIAGLGGVTGIDQALRAAKMTGISGFGGMAEADVGRQFQAELANQEMDMRAQQLTEQGYNQYDAKQMAMAELGLQGLGGERSLYGTTPAMAATFGNQALEAYNQRARMEEARNRYGLDLIGTQIGALGQQAQPGRPWWQTALDIGSRVAPMFIPGAGPALSASRSFGGMMPGMPSANPSSLLSNYYRG